MAHMDTVSVQTVIGLKSAHNVQHMATQINIVLEDNVVSPR